MNDKIDLEMFAIKAGFMFASIILLVMFTELAFIASGILGVGILYAAIVTGVAFAYASEVGWI